ncbi:hypothetical protein ACSBR1_000162 [Camellia fascicularis]
MVETRRDKVYPLVYLLLTLALILHVATATVERVFSAMNIVKNRLQNRMGDEWMNDSLVVYIERDIFYGIDNDTIMERFQKMKTRRGQFNVIVITLLAKSGQLSGETPAINNAETDLYDELIKNIGNEINYGPENCPPVPESKEIVYEEKQIVSELIAVTPKSNELITETVSCAKVLRKSQSEMLKRENSKKNCRKLRFLPLSLLGSDKGMFGGVVWLYIFF